jgi:hypothetical protein
VASSAADSEPVIRSTPSRARTIGAPSSSERPSSASIDSIRSLVGADGDDGERPRVALGPLAQQRRLAAARGRHEHRDRRVGLRQQADQPLAHDRRPSAAGRRWRRRPAPSVGRVPDGSSPVEHLPPRDGGQGRGPASPG